MTKLHSILTHRDWSRALSWSLLRLVVALALLSACNNDLGPRGAYSLSPSRGSKDGGTLVTVTGPLLSADTLVSFDGEPARDGVLLSPDRLQVTAPPHAVGAVDVVITEGIGVTTTLRAAFSYENALEVSSLRPAIGATRGGTQVTLSGEGFTRATKVRFGEALGGSHALVDEHTLRVIAPAHAEGTVDVVVSDPGATTVTLAEGFSYDPKPLEVTRFSPSSGPAEGGTEVMVAGSRFGADARVFFGETLADEVEIIDAGLLRVTTPASLPGKVHLRVEAGDQVGESALEFTFTEGGGASKPGVAPRVVSAASLDNTHVLVAFSEAMDDHALSAKSYSIAWSPTEVQSAAPGLAVESAEFQEQSNTIDRSRVILTTLSQSDLRYTLRVAGVRDLDGEPFAPMSASLSGLIDPSTADFTGTAPGGMLIDSDSDGLSDAEETRGYLVEVRVTSGSSVSRWVTSDPYVADTDEDGLDDTEERHLVSDPRSADTDGDRLNDDTEFNQVFSDQNSQDTDGDAVDDSLEVGFFKTNPVSTDTDGDGFSDGDELLKLARNPRVADLPEHEIRVSDVTLSVDERFSYSDESGRTVTDNSSTSSTLRQSASTKYARSSSESHSFQLGSEFTYSYGSSTTVKVSKDPSVSSTVDQNAGIKLSASTSHDWTLQTSSESAAESETTAASSRERGLSLSRNNTVTRQVVGARIDASVGLRNLSDLAFGLKNVEISVLATDPTDRARFTPVATLIPNSELLTGQPASFNLGPLQPERGPVIFSNRDVFPNLVDDLMQHPRGLIFRVVNFDLVDESGREFTFKSQLAHDATAALLIDYGDGTTERFLVATSGGFDGAGELVGGFDASGNPRGIPLDFALQDILGLEKNRSTPDAILAGPNGSAQSVAQGDDVQVISGGIDGLLDDTVVISAGENGVLDSTTGGDDTTGVVSGYTTAKTCAADTPGLIVDGGNGRAETPSAVRDEQATPYGSSELEPGAIIVTAGSNGFIDSVPGGDDAYVGPGMLCETDADCHGGSCNGREGLSRLKHRRHGTFGRFWTVLTEDRSPLGLDFGSIVLHPGQTLLLAFVQDLDRDGVIAQQEYLYGSSDTQQDTDGDGLDDYSEIRVGWEIGVADGSPIRRVYPNPRSADSDRDGLGDREEQDLRRVTCECFGGERAGASCDAGCGSGFCGTALPLGERCSGPGCSPCATEATRSDPRRRDSDNDGVADAAEVLGSLSGAAIVEPRNVIIAGASRRAETLACPEDVCEGGERAGDSCRRKFDCPGGTCRVTGCDDVQVVPVGTTGVEQRTVIVAPGADGILSSVPQGENRRVDAGDGRASTQAVADDRGMMAAGAEAASGSDLIKPGPNGVIDSAPAGDDVACYGQLVKNTNPLNPDTDFDQIRDGFELVLGSDPTDALDSGSYSDRDGDGLSDAEESVYGWTVCVGTNPEDCTENSSSSGRRRVYSNPNVSDSDLDGLPDYAERRLGTDPGSPDSDSDGLSDFDECSREALTALAKFRDFFKTYAIEVDESKQYGTSPLSLDSDVDGLSDRTELLESFSMAVPGETTVRQGFTSPLRADTDLDGLNDRDELAAHTDLIGGEVVRWRTDPTDPDTDDDGRLDGREVDRAAGALTNPLAADIAVTVRWDAVLFGANESDWNDQLGQNLADWGLRLAVMYPGSPRFPGDVQLDVSDDADCLAFQGTPDGACPNRCIIPLGRFNGPALRDDESDPGVVTFPMREGQSFTLTVAAYNFDLTYKEPQEQPGSCFFVDGGNGKQVELPFTFEAVRQGGTNKDNPQSGAYLNSIELWTGARVLYDIGVN